MGLVFLSPGIREGIFNGELNVTRLQLRPVVGAIPWQKQEMLVSSLAN